MIISIKLLRNVTALQWLTLTHFNAHKTEFQPRPRAVITGVPGLAAATPIFCYFFPWSPRSPQWFPLTVASPKFWTLVWPCIQHCNYFDCILYSFWTCYASHCNVTAFCTVNGSTLSMTVMFTVFDWVITPCPANVFNFLASQKPDE